MIMEIYGNLPANIIYKILSYVHNPQPPELLEDIKIIIHLQIIYYIIMM